MRLYFKPLTMEDLEHAYHWFQEPLIQQRYARNQVWSLDDVLHKYQPRISGTENIPSFIIEIENHPVGFIQYYCLKEYLPEGVLRDDNPLFEKYSSGAMVGIDMLIAEEKNRGRGLGVHIINQFVLEFLMRYQLIIVDPEKNNLQAIRCYEKADFKKTDFSSNESYLLLVKEIKIP